MEQTALAIRKTEIINSFSDLERAATAMARSGYFQDSREQAQAIVKILAGQEMGFGPFASMTGVHIIQGRPAIGANLMAAAVKSSGRYNYRVVEMTDKVCSIKFFEGKEEIGVSTFTIEDARKAGTKNLDKFPRNMLFARAMSNGVRWYCPDVFNGSAVYTPEELGANVNEDGDVIDVPFSGPAQAQPKPEYSRETEIMEELGFDTPPASPQSTITLETAEAIVDREGVRYGDKDSKTLTHMSRSIAKRLRENHLTQEERDELQLKLDAIAVILQSRAQAQPN